ncbi:MAG: electron transfer flavoprotein beta subunit/FixA family protein [Nitrospinaceae bacterium]|nr:electron transfer flavoprotein subunit beta/FixA family protein [Nitrospinaceae bacterium]NIR54713.1 electron transfer flavoprotein subunit beta/FixA family protein [Nitrospinaceae bacterium]NIS85134.1 electron transfer flavoprotein subunit beta/FixA family protein [Nitrospinaceae bacterium]NIT81951.1 electron transfer flavoprotein subunit beta/FixA family protein [Nitrospinaceae bacterium]NIU44212.1 electron transfer flavoprotein subunit beta/FixA family protein [Nitrospinaceae bacterium]
MDIIVCIKQVIDTGASIAIKDGAVDTEGLPRVVNPYDEFAIEEAVRLREKFPETTVTLLTLGPEGFKDTLRKGLAMGADRAVHLLDPAFDGLDTLGVATALSKAIRTLQYDLILCGRQAVDDDMAQVGPAIAVLLDIPFVTVVTELKLNEAQDRAEVTRQIEGGSEILEFPLPALLTCQKGLNEPRLPSLKGIMAAKKKEITTLDAAAIGFDPELMGARANRVREVELALPPARTKGKILEGDASQVSGQLVKILRDEVKVI